MNTKNTSKVKVNKEALKKSLKAKKNIQNNNKIVRK